MAKKKKRKKKQHRFFWFTVKLQIVFMLLVLAGLGYYFFGGYATEVQRLKLEAVQLVSQSTEDTFCPVRTSSVYDTNGNLISEKNGEKDAVYVEYDQIPQNVVQAMVSIEDKRFYQHNGVELKAIIRAAKAAVANGELSQGGSTITMQLAKLIYLDSSKTWQRKVEQIFIALELEKRYSKNKIMEFYLNNIYFANGYYGIQAATEGYFNCSLQDLDLAQITFLLAIPNRPTYYNPVTNIDNTIERKNRILDNMLDDGKIDISTYHKAIDETIVLNRAEKTGNLQNNYVDTYTYYCAVRALMETEGFEFQYTFSTEEERQNYLEEYDELYTDCQKRLDDGGYKIYTSIDLDKQNELQDAVDSALAGFTEVGDDGMYSLQGSAVSIDNTTGQVVAIVGGRSQEFNGYTLNRAYQSFRQPGSSIKPLNVYTPILERGYTADSIVTDEEFEGGPKNASKTYAGDVTLRYAVEHSLNTVAWKLYDELTPEVGLSYLKNMNFSQIKDKDYTLATSIGGFTKGMSAVEMASGYATIENDGIYRVPTCIKSIINSRNEVVYATEKTDKQVYKQTAARMMTDILSSVMTNGLGRGLQLNNMPSAGKTGTTNDNKDGWFCGYTRYYTTAVWVGYDIPKEVPGLAGSSYPGTIWKTYMNRVHEGLTPLEFLPYAQLSDEFKENLQNNKTQEEDTPEDGAEVQEADPGQEDVPDANANDLNEPQQNNGVEDVPQQNANEASPQPDQGGVEDIPQQNENPANSQPDQGGVEDAPLQNENGDNPQANNGGVDNSPQADQSVDNTDGIPQN